jgi:hypothetical protein
MRRLAWFELRPETAWPQPRRRDKRDHHLPTHCATISLLVASIRPKNRSFEVSGCGGGQDGRLLGPQLGDRASDTSCMQRDGDAVDGSNVVSGAVHVSPKTGQGVAGRSRVSLITIAQPREELARRAVALPLARIEVGSLTSGWR